MTKLKEGLVGPGDLVGRCLFCRPKDLTEADEQLLLEEKLNIEIKTTRTGKNFGRPYMACPDRDNNHGTFKYEFARNCGISNTTQVAG